MTGLTFRGESVSRSVGSGVSDGAGVIGDSIGITDTQLMTTTGTTPAARTFYNRNNFYRGGGERGGGFNRSGGQAFNGDTRAARGYAEPRGQSGVRSGAFSGYGTAERKEAFPRVEAPASAGEAPAVAAVVSDMAADSAVDMAAVATDRRTTHMRQTKFRELYWVRLASAAILVAACLPQGSVAQQPGQKTFSSPQDASTALVAAVAEQR